MTLQIDKQPNQAWAFTYKFLCNKIENNVSSYAPVINNLNTHGYIKHIQHENDSKGRVHIHGIVLLRKGFLRKKLIVPGFNCHLSEILNEDGWMKYCDKDQPKPLKQIPYLFDPLYELNN